MTSFRKLFQDATGLQPYPYQEALAGAPRLPEVLSAPTGAGKTAAVVLSWLYRRRFSSPEVRGQTPRRLVLCFPMRTLVSQAAAACRGWLQRLEFLDEGRGLDRGEGIGLHVWMGGASDDDAHLHPEKDAIFLGTQDMLLSRALNRGYGSSRFRWPWDFALFSNDCLWVFDEIQLMGAGLATGLQLDALRRTFGTFGPTQSLFMSATLDPRWLITVDHPTPGQVHLLGPSDLAFPELKKRRTARKSLHRARAEFQKEDLKPLAREVAEHHVPGTRTLVILNTVDRAVSLLAALEKEKALKGTNRVLLHSRFRPPERAAALAEATQPGFDGIVVSTQVIEAGVDISSRTLFSDLAPWPSIVQRAGRCNRFGELDQAAIFWIDHPGGMPVDEKAALPYEPSHLESARTALSALAGASCEELENARVRLDAPDFPHVIRKRDLIELFDTTPDLSGADIDVSRFIREGEERDVQVFWRDLRGERPTRELPAARREELCPVPFLSLRKALEARSAYRWNHIDGEWRAVAAAAVFPGGLYVLDAAEGGYSERTGWDPKSKSPVLVLAADGPPEEDVTSDPWSEIGSWVALSTHATDTGVAMTEILDALALSNLSFATLVRSARAHDLGKSHPVFQETMRRSRPESEAGTLWAKSGFRGARHERAGFRHELASALAWLQNGDGEDRELIAYLLAAHHGKVRLSLRSLPRDAQPPDPRQLNSRGIFQGDALPETDLGEGGLFPATTLSLAPMQMGREGGRQSWAEIVLGLRDRFGPFRLAFLEMLVRAADVRASMRGEKK